MKTSIIIPIFNAENYLDSLFSCLEKNSFEIGDEILLIDNGSTDNSIKICKRKVDEHPDLYRFLSYTEKASSYAARNYGVRNSNGDIIVFADSDTKPIDTWITAIKDNIQKGVVIAGKIELEVINNGLWELYDNIAHLNSEKNAADSRVATANMAVFREDFERVGEFEERFSGGDYDWSLRAKNAGLKIVFLPEGLVYHPTRKTFDQILKKEQRIAYGAGNHYRLNNKPFAFLFIKYILKFFKIDTQIRHYKSLKNLGVSDIDLKEFNSKFPKIRLEHLKYAIRGYRFDDARKLNIK